MKPNIVSSLDSWLSYLESIHPKSIDLSLDRIKIVADAMNISIKAIKFIIGGTNGKGSTCAFLESFLLESGYAVGLYTSPHIVLFNERIRVNGNSVEDEEIVENLSYVDKCRGKISLTYFEFTTLAALNIFSKNNLDVLILEIGLGGRLDAVNIIDADCSIVTNIGIDHIEWLGDTRDFIAKEKAFIYRSNKPAICGDFSPPDSLLNHASEINTNLYLINKDFQYEIDIANREWSYFGINYIFKKLPFPKIFGDNQIINASVALAALDLLNYYLPVQYKNICSGIEKTFVPGRFQIISTNPSIIIDVAHNSHAASILSKNLQAMGSFSKTYAVIGMLKDKDLIDVIKKTSINIDYWYCASTYGSRGLKASDLSHVINKTIDSNDVITYDFSSPYQALCAVLSKASEQDRIIVFGSFTTVADIYNNIHHIL
ncbi:dihydrofolate synthase/folylpolyglutamate synthase [Candidatus Kinetoplastibacterium desouzaii TCC079E]|uniref:Dihydrofolate synthase/folylpolyglutamate synthase n=1 Tax=Candidatus Kinetoplastidibacterium desouzai TCC079E TaxID=1208919 RepID=M1L292_9PROT|nr:bifunctional tetrahydrofolate synthase/dihydrofolate synthase [Candidatus Kinetoplastibacterium desouzaii]AGF46868.1 dihydrofolate synthase/folylpolyglutamate synthase [Candidatus Kinetoplastibacterium desouzaii TCC079E]